MIRIALYEKEPTTSPLLHDDENDLHSQAIYHNIPMAKTYNKQNINKKKITFAINDKIAIYISII